MVTGWGWGAFGILREPSDVRAAEGAWAGNRAIHEIRNDKRGKRRWSKRLKASLFLRLAQTSRPLKGDFKLLNVGVTNPDTSGWRRRGSREGGKCGISLPALHTGIELSVLFQRSLGGR